MPKQPMRKRGPIAAEAAEAKVDAVKQKDMILGQMELWLKDACDAMVKLAEYPMELDEVNRVRKICDVMLDLRRAMYRFAVEHDDLIHGIKSRPGREFEHRQTMIVTARNPRKIRRQGATR